MQKNCIKRKRYCKELQTQQQIAFEKFRVAFVEDERLSKVPVLIQILEQTEKTQRRLQTLLDLQKIRVTVHRQEDID